VGERHAIYPAPSGFPLTFDLLRSGGTFELPSDHFAIACRTPL
jgi:hypothetical protein